MKRHLSLLILLLWVVTAFCGIPEYTNEDLSYRVTYKWGFIQKQAGSASFSLKEHADHYSAVLTARTQPWADKIFQVRDTLTGTMRLGDMAPTLYVKSTHEGGEYRHDVIKYAFTGDLMTAQCERLKINKKGEQSVTDTTLVANLPGTDMLSVYYLVRRLPFDTMKVGTIARASIFSGKKIEQLAVKYLGIETIKLNDRKYRCYKINFTFSSERMKNSSAPMWAWISTEGQRIPIKLIGELPIGQIQVLYNEPN
ncbi:MAG: DUF3108 domain-containing protein [Bacteroides sp.]|nr:DUF3108 domain-containing protein [Bacteroides sp.]MCM1379775.1 DUF3108 domain-containing protein [Bacteroides sp.]MCM1445684.1 DUF3108 domain-containing protein [Prevotella sp.]